MNAGIIQREELAHGRDYQRIANALAYVDANYQEQPSLAAIAAQTVGRTAGHTDVCLWYVVVGDRRISLEYCREEFDGIGWFHRSELPETRVEPDLARFVMKFFGADKAT